MFSEGTNRETSIILGSISKLHIFFGHTRTQLTELPRLFRLRVARALDLSKDFVDPIDIDRVEKSRLVKLVREYLPLKPYTDAVQCSIKETLRNGIAKRESEYVPIINNAIQEIRQRDVELPPLVDLETLARHVLTSADRSGLPAEPGHVHQTDPTYG